MSVQHLCRLIVLAVGLLTACATAVDRRLEQIVREALPRLVGPADGYDVAVRGAHLGADRVDELRATGRRVRREAMPVVDRMEIVLADVLIDRTAGRIESVGAAAVTLELTADDLTEYLRTQPWIDEPQVRLAAPAEVIVSGRLRIPGLGFVATPLGELRGELVPRGSLLLVRVSALSLAGRSAPGVLRAVLEQAINPLVDTARHAMPSRIDEAQVRGDRLLLQASGSRSVPTR